MSKDNEIIQMNNLVDNSVIQQELDFDFQERGFSKEMENECYAMKYENDLADANNIIIKGRNFSKLREYCKHTKNQEQDYNDCIEIFFGTKRSTAQKYIQYSNALLDIYGKVPDKTYDEVIKLGIHKVSYLAKLPTDKKIQIVENAPIGELRTDEFRELTKKMKEAEEYSDELVEEIRKKDQKIRENRDSVEQKDKEIQELKSKIQELESGNVQPVAEVQEKIVEKVVEKEVIPKEIQEELKALKQLVKERKEIPEHILNELSSLRTEVAKKDELLNEAKSTVEAIATQTNSKFGVQDVDWNSLGNIVSHFLGGASEFSYMKDAYKQESAQKKQYINSQVNKIEKWVLQMKDMMNETLTIGNVIYDNVDFKIEE